MKTKMDIYYDEEGDYLEITTGNIKNCKFKNLGRGVFKIVDKTGITKGVAISSFRKKTSTLKNIQVPLPIELS